MPSAQHADEVADQMDLGVVAHLGRHVGLAVPALVGRQHVEAGIGQRDELVTPRVPALGEPVAQHHRGPVGRPRLGDVHADAVGVDEPVRGHAARKCGITLSPQMRMVSSC